MWVPTSMASRKPPIPTSDQAIPLVGLRRLADILLGQDIACMDGEPIYAV